MVKEHFTIANPLRLISISIALSFSFPNFAQAATSHLNCSELLKFPIQNGKIISAQSVGAGNSKPDPYRMFTGANANVVKLPKHCVVKGLIDERKGADGKDYAIRFEVRLPDNWQQRFMFQGGGGTDGFLANSIGTIPVLGSTAEPALSRGYAVASMNGGHDGTGPLFGLDQKARIDYAYAAIGKVTIQAKRVIEHYYQNKEKFSYFMGCSNGGREAMISAQRYPNEFDGVVAGNPGFRLSKAALGEVWDLQTLYKITPKDKSGEKILANALTDEDLNLVSNSILKQCDALDGVTDGIVNDYLNCDFSPEVLLCSTDRQSNCLSEEKVSAITSIFNGAKDSRGNQVYSSWPYDAGINSQGWRMWKLGNSQDPNKPDALSAVLGSDSLKYYFMTPPQPTFDLLQFDFDEDVSKVYETGALNDASSTYMNSFANKGGKLLIFQGVSDPVFSANDIVDWYNQTGANTSGGNMDDLRQWNRLFMVPGMAHCGGGPALDNFDPLTAIQNWVEEGQMPTYLKATGQAFPNKSQPICSYPETAHYNGKGDINSSNSYYCK